MTHQDICIFCMSGIKENCPLRDMPVGDLKDFIRDEFSDPLRAARGMIYAVGFMLMVYGIVVMWWIAF